MNSSSMDDRTVLITQEPNQVNPTLTESPSAPKFNQLQERMVYAARIKPEEYNFAGNNPLISAASSLLCITCDLKKESYQDIELLKPKLVEELKSFEFQAINSGVESNYVALSRYLLCTFVDEIIVTTPWGSESHWASKSMNPPVITNANNKLHIIILFIFIDNPNMFSIGEQGISIESSKEKNGFSLLI